MKKFNLFIFVILFTFIFGVKGVSADSTTPPVVSIGIGNSNFPENTGPVHDSSYNGDVSVYATITDDDLDNYHFRVIKDGGLDGFTCTDLGALFASENQGYASTTLNKDACGFVFNKSIYTSPTGFTDSLIATLNSADLIAFGGEGDYWLILGAVDTAGNRTNSNYLNDSKIKITVTNTPVAVTPEPVVSAPASGGGAGNGPIVNSYGSISSGFSPASVGNPQLFAPVVEETLPVSNSGAEGGVILLADGGIPANESNSVSGDTSVNDGIDGAEEVSSTSDQLAQTVSSGFNYNWLWLLILVLVLGGGYYYFTKKD